MFNVFMASSKLVVPKFMQLQLLLKSLNTKVCVFMKFHALIK